MEVRTFVYRLHPTRAQHASFRSILDDQRHLYNAALQERRDAWSKSGISIGLNEQTKSLTEIRSFDEAYSGVPYNLSKWTLKRLDDAFKAFFRRTKRGGKAGFPRFRSASRWQSFGFHQKDGLRLRDSRLLFSGGLVGGLRVRMHRPLPDGAVIKSAVFTHEDGIWRVSLACAVSAAEAVDDGTVIGIDVGVSHLATDSDGQHYGNIRPRSQREKDLRIAARALARCKKGSMRRRKVAARLRTVQRSVRNHRRTYLHDVANAIVKTASTIVVEDLKLRNMTRSASGTLENPGVNVRQSACGKERARGAVSRKAGLNRALADAAPGRLIQMLTYKAESAGGQVIRVNPRNTSRMCSSCGVIDAAQLSKHRYRCQCGLDLQRDHNAAINIRERGVKALHEAARRLGEPNVAGCGVRAPGSADLIAA